MVFVIGTLTREDEGFVEVGDPLLLLDDVVGR